MKKAITIIADDRETNGANPYFDKYIVADNAQYRKKSIKAGRGDIKLCIGRVTTGDYNILLHPTSKPIVALIIERKTWKDLAASIKDGRLKTQHKEMHKIANRLGCQMMYIIEGKLTYKKSTNVARHMPFKNLIAKVRRTVLRGVPIIQTKDQEHTADMIVDLARDMWRLYQNDEITIGGGENISYVSALRQLNEKYRGLDPLVPLVEQFLEDNIEEQDSSDVIEAVEKAEQLVDDTDDVETIANLNLIGVHADNTDIPAILKEKKIKSDSDILTRMWIAIPTVSTKTAPTLMEKFQLSDLISANSTQKENFIKQIALIKYPSGNKIGETRAKKIMEIAYTGAATTKLDKLKTISSKILAEIDGITRDAANKILEKYSLRQICCGEITAEDLAKIQKTAKRKVGLAKAQQILRLLN